MISDVNNAFKKDDEPSWLHGPDILPSRLSVTEPRGEEVKAAPIDEEADIDESGTPIWMGTKAINSTKRPSPKSGRLSASAPRIVVETPSGPADDTCYCCGCRIDPILITFQLYHIAAGIVSIISISTNFYVFTTMIGESSNLREVLLRIYAVMFAIVAVLVETELDIFMKYFLIFQSWFVRGLWYAFIGIITGSASISLTLTIDTIIFFVVRGESAIAATENIVGLAMSAFGVVYMVMVSSSFRYLWQI